MCKNPENKCNSWNTKYSGQDAGSPYKPTIGRSFYIRIGITLNKKSRLYLAHRLAFLYLEGEFPLEDVDHIDGNGLNNKFNNLRKVNHRENSKNLPLQSNNKSGYTGVIWHKQHQKWYVRIGVNGKSISGGLFADKNDAIAKRMAMNIEYGFHKNHGRKNE